MSMEIEQIRQKLNDHCREIMNLLSSLNETETTVSRLKKELNDMYDKINSWLNGENSS